jgi:hypothetical protein
MVPDDDQAGVQLAKKLCADCPVVAECRALAEQVTTTFGPDFAQGVWGGLTLRERGTMVGLPRSPLPCAQCGLICVPVSHTTDRCDICDTTTEIDYAEYHPQIVEMIAAGLTYRQVADGLHLSQRGVTDACRRWKIRAGATSARRTRALKECGTLAAKERHRKHRESWENCACKHVRWKKGNRKSETLAGANTN